MLTIDVIIDEIGLEGSDGITFECLFERLRKYNNGKELTDVEIKQLFRVIVRDRVCSFKIALKYFK